LLSQSDPLVPPTGTGFSMLIEDTQIVSQLTTFIDSPGTLPVVPPITRYLPTATMTSVSTDPPTVTSTPETKLDLSPGEIAGICIGAVGFIITVVVAYYQLRAGGKLHTMVASGIHTIVSHLNGR
jgi:hypothetical protein